MTFRDRLLATLRAVEPVLEVPGVLVTGSEVPNLLEVDAAATLVVSQDVDLAIPVVADGRFHRRDRRPSYSTTTARRPCARKARVRSNGEKGDRDLLVVAGLLAAMTPADFEQFERGYLGLSSELRHQVRSNLSILSLLDARPGMPDPRSQRPIVDALLRRLET